MEQPARSYFSMPVPEFQEQDRRFARAFAIIEAAISSHAFPAASLGVTHSGRMIAWKGFGRFTYDAGSAVVSPTTIFDIASVTKIVATTSMAMLLYERGLLDLEMPVGSVLPEFIALGDARKREVTVRMLLAHSSGLPAYVKLFEHAETRDELIGSAITAPLVTDPMTKAEYSDIGFIVLGELLRRVADERFDAFCQREIFGPLGMASTSFRPPDKWRPQIVPTVHDERYRGRVIQGEVHDENASVMDGVAGHAGVFSSAYDLSVFAHCVLSGGHPVFRRQTIDLFTRRECAPPGTSRALGWDTPSQPSQSGRYFSPVSFGHLGYTGTSLWCDPVRQLSVTFLTNRVWPDCSSQEIKLVRPAVHDAIVEALEEKD